MAVRAKFACQSITRHQSLKSIHDAAGKYIGSEPCELRTVKLSPVSGGSEENKKFWEASPSGSIEIGCANLAAAEAFELGKEYYVDFTPAG